MVETRKVGLCVNSFVKKEYFSCIFVPSSPLLWTAFWFYLIALAVTSVQTFPPVRRLLSRLLLIFNAALLSHFPCHPPPLPPSERESRTRIKTFHTKLFYVFDQRRTRAFYFGPRIIKSILTVSYVAGIDQNVRSGREHQRAVYAREFVPACVRRIWNGKYLTINTARA